MCNAYNVQPKLKAKDLDALVSEAIAALKSPLIRRSDPGVVVTMRDGTLQPETMRWGFVREFVRSPINNARADKLDSPMWQVAVAASRCLVPVSSFYEWQELPGGGKLPYEIRRPDRQWMWVAGLFERTQAGGSYATITTDPTPEFSRIHDRLLAIVDFDAGMAFLAGERPAFAPYTGSIEAVPCESPLKRRGPGTQGSLF
jgi:putative SOS response-associated peptidase YedK